MSRTSSRIWRAAMAAVMVVASLSVARAVPLGHAANAQADEVYSADTTGVSLPKVVTRVAAKYTDEAMRARIEGVLVLETVVRSDGSLGQIGVAQSLDEIHGLDLEGIAALKQWTFEP